MTLQLAAGQHIVAYTDEIPPGSRKIVTIEGREIGIFNIRGTFRAFLNRCPHMSGPLCEGEVMGLIESSGPGDMSLNEERQFLTCPLHNWEFDVETGQSYCDPEKMRAKVFRVETAPTLVPPVQEPLIPTDPGKSQRIPGEFVAEVYDVTVERGAVIVNVGRPRREK